MPPAAKPAAVLSLRLRGAYHAAQPILGGIDLDLYAGDAVALTGPSGAGKSTLLRIVAGLHKGFDGTCHKTPRIGMVFQEPVLMPWRSALQNLTLTCGISTPQAALAMAEVGLSGLEDRFPAQMSLGQQRRLSLARAFACQPQLLLMDEPFVSLDPELGREMMELTARMRAQRGTALLLVTHIMDEARGLADRVMRLDGTPARLAQLA